MIVIKEIELQITYFCCKIPSHGNETYLNEIKYACHCTIYFMERVEGQY